ncbi:MAG: FAD-binding protein, partial [Clostridiales bacterium]|nr:FAD-binding protein [Clostridiales bacterium]
REHAAKDFILDETGKIKGVKASDPGGETVVNCRTCLIATGSLINSDILGRVIPDFKDAFTRRYGHRLPTLTGDGVEMAERAGIPIDYDSICIAHLGPLCLPVDMQSIHFGKPIPADMLAHVNRGEALRVNMNGERWINESFCGETSWRLLKQPKCVSWTILDSRLMSIPPMPDALTLVDPDKGRMLNNAIPTPGKEPDPRAVVRGGTPGFIKEKPINVENLKYFAGLPGKHLVMADTVEELAKGMEIPAEKLKATIERYNELCKKGIDEDFYKDAEHLLPLETGPFYAFHTFLASDGAFGGLGINENMQVLGKEGPVTGLYAAGDNTSGRYVNLGGDKVQIINDLTWAVASGYVAAENMAAELV